MSFTTIVMDEVVVIDNEFFREVDRLSDKYPSVIQSLHEQLQMAKALRTVSILKKKNGIK